MYDFIVVGSGPAGASVATRLAETNAAPRVLLLEAGDNMMQYDAYPSADKALPMLDPMVNRGYKTVAQKHLAGRELDYSRGLGLGGSTIINLQFWTTGAKGDYEEWAERVGDDAFNWTNSQRLFKKIEKYSMTTRKENRRYVNPDLDVHGSSGAVDVEFPDHLPEILTTSLEAIVDSGVKLNLDANTGDPIGVAIQPTSSKYGYRVTAKTAYLNHAPSNLIIKPKTRVDRILFNGTKAVGVITNNGQYSASNEIIISCGALDSPKLLMLSGIGPKSHLAMYGIECIKDLPVGQDLRDHVVVSGFFQLNEAVLSRAWAPTAANVTTARAQFLKDGTGPFTYINGSIAMGFARDESNLQLDEFAKLPPEEQRLMRRDTVPLEEFAAGPQVLPHFPDTLVLGWSNIHMNPQSAGSVTLASANPADAPICDPACLSHPLDRAALLKDVHRLLSFAKAPAVTALIKTPILAPASESDEDIMEFVEKTASTAWHMSCTVKMGKKDDPGACVDADFKVKGIEKLRVVDLSVTPFLPNCHTTATGYWLGELAAEKISKAYNLNG